MMNTAEPLTRQQLQALRVLLVHASALLPAAEWQQSVSHTSRAWRHVVRALVLADQTVLFTSDLCVKHAVPRRSEKPERLRVVLDKCVVRFPSIQVVRELPMATPSQLSRFHTELHVDTITRLGTKIETSMDALDKLRLVDTQGDGAALLLSLRSQAASAAKKPHQTTKAMSKHEYYAQFEYIDMDDDTVMMRHTLDASMTAAGGVCHAIDRVLLSEKEKNKAKPRNAFCVVRPPGHHAEPQRAMGFCFFNNVGVGAFHALDAHKLTRVAIIDFDVHHGNGTQKRVESEPQILYVSLHQAPLYPGTGFSHETGKHNNIVNVPLKARTDSKTYRKLFLEKVWPRVAEFQPQLLLVSAGFDAHTHDPLADIRLQSEDYYWITREITKMAWRFCDGRVVSVLEGGYHFKALGESAEQHVLALVHGSVSPH